VNDFDYSSMLIEDDSNMENNLSTRGNALADQKPAFLDVLQDIWDPVENPNGIVNIGLAENVKPNDCRMIENYRY